jgi:hypothetical protein
MWSLQDRHRCSAHVGSHRIKEALRAAAEGLLANLNRILKLEFVHFPDQANLPLHVAELL